MSLSRCVSAVTCKLYQSAYSSCSVLAVALMADWLLSPQNLASCMAGGGEGEGVDNDLATVSGRKSRMTHCLTGSPIAT